MSDFTNSQIFGTVIAFTYVDEFQKRGLPHAHTLLILNEESKLSTAQKIDEHIKAEIPNRMEDPRLYNLVSAHMFHEPCGALNRRSPCMLDNNCTKNYPKRFAENTELNVGGLPLYQRRNDGNSVSVRGHQLDNRWVVPYNPFLLRKFSAHINVEACVSQRSVKYLYKYIYKGHDTLTCATRNNDEISTYANFRYVSPPEAFWRIYAKPLHLKSHTIVRLDVHLPNEQNIIFVEGEESVAVETETGKDTTLTAYFRLNDPNARARTALLEHSSALCLE